MRSRILIAMPVVLGLMYARAWSGSSHVAHPPKKADTTPGAILVESYQLGKTLDLEERAILLNYLSQTAAEHRLACTSVWAEENLRLAQQLPLGWNRLAIEKNAIVALSYVKPDRAMRLLRSMDLPVSDGVGFPEDVRAVGADEIFQNYWRVHRPKGVPVVRAEAVYLGQTGQYPYMGIRRLVEELAATSPQQRGQLPELAQSLVLEAYSFYERGSKFQTDDDQFAEFLKTLHPILPVPLLRQGLELAVERLLDTDRPLDQQGYLAQVQTEKGTATFHRRQQRLLFELLPLVREVDPDWVTKIVRRDPDMGQAEANSGKEITSYGIVTPGETVAPEAQSYGFQFSRAEAAGQMAQTDPDGAMSMAQTIVNPSLRAVALANIAGAVGPSAQGRVEEIEKAIAGTMSLTKEGQGRLLALSAQARAAAAAGDMAVFHDVLNRCFALGEELFEGEMDAHPRIATYTAVSYNILDDLVKPSVSFDPATTISKVEQIRDPALKAYLLNSLAAALYDVQKPEISPKNPPQSKRGTDQPASVTKTP